MDRITLNKLLTNNDAVFSTVEGKPWRPNTVARAWETTAAHAGVKSIRLNDAGCTRASLRLKQGIHPKIGWERLGHAGIQMTLDTYSHVVPGLQEAAAVRFDDLVKPKRENKAVAEVGWQNASKTGFRGVGKGWIYVQNWQKGNDW